MQQRASRRHSRPPELLCICGIIRIESERTGREGDLLGSWFGGGIVFHAAILAREYGGGDTEGLRCYGMCVSVIRFSSYPKLEQAASGRDLRLFFCLSFE